MTIGIKIVNVYDFKWLDIFVFIEFIRIRQNVYPLLPVS